MGGDSMDSCSTQVIHLTTAGIGWRSDGSRPKSDLTGKRGADSCVLR